MWRHAAAALLILLLGARLGVSAALLLGDSLKTASGADITLARRHPQWREPCRYVRERCDGAAVLTTTYLPVLHYVGRVDDWYPSHKLWWEHVESGSPGIKTIEELAAFVAAHPRGYFLADVQRFSRWTGRMAEHVAWVEEHMTRVEEASNRDIAVWAWGLDAYE